MDEVGETGGEGLDPLGLDDCPPLNLDEPAPLPVASWDDPQDHEVMCALRALDAAVADRQIICLGENGHGISESNLWQALMARYLVHELGVRTIAVEAERAGTSRWNDYIATGDPALLAAGFEGVDGSLANSVENELWVEALAVVQDELPEGERLTFTGYDVSVQPELGRLSLLEFLADAAPEEVDTWSQALPSGEEPDDVVIDWLAAGDAAEALRAQLEAEAADYVGATDAQRHRDALVDAADLRDGYRFLYWYRQDNFEVGNATYREPGMIRNVERMRAELPADQPLLLVSHNRHCARDWIIGNDEGGLPSPAVGTHIAQAYGDDYLHIAQAYQRGTYTRRSDGEFETIPFSANPLYLESVIGSATTEDALLIDDLPPGEWEMWSQSPLEPTAQFDMLLWLRDVEATTIRD